MTPQLLWSQDLRKKILTGRSRAAKEVKSRDAARPGTREEQCMVMLKDRCPARCISDEEALLGVRQSVGH